MASVIINQIFCNVTNHNNHRKNMTISENWLVGEKDKKRCCYHLFQMKMQPNLKLIWRSILCASLFALALVGHSNMILDFLANQSGNPNMVTKKWMYCLLIWDVSSGCLCSSPWTLPYTWLFASERNNSSTSVIAPQLLVLTNQWTPARIPLF